MCGGDKEKRKTYSELSLLYQVIGSVQIQYKGDTYALKCRWLKWKAFEIIAEPPGKAFLGVTNYEKKWLNPDEEVVDIKRHIRHADTYRQTPEIQNLHQVPSGEEQAMASSEAMTSRSLNYSDHSLGLNRLAFPGHPTPKTSKVLSQSQI